ncbi:MAG: FtsX-like permease family protein [Myxococcota bacterium]
MWRLAWRNLWRNRTRTAITMTAITFSLALMLISQGINEYSYEQMLGSADKAAGGSVLVNAAGYWNSRGSELVLDDGAAVVATVRSALPKATVLPRVIIQGLLSSSHGNQGLEVHGIDPAAEDSFRNIKRYLAEGDFLDGEQKQPLVLGRGIADDLGLQLGDRVVLTATDPDGEMVRALFRLSGVLDSGSRSVDDAAAYTTLAAAQQAVSLGDRLTQVGVVLPAAASPDDAKRALLAAFGAKASALEVLTWAEAMPEIIALIEMDSKMGEGMLFAIFIIVVFGIANTLLMAVMERIRELGLLSALGMTPQRIGALVLAETVLLALVSITLAVGIALAAHAALQVYGIDMAAFSEGEVEMSGVIVENLVIHSTIVPAKWLGAIGAVFALVVLAALYPAWRATRVNPTEAMRTYA